VTGREPFDVCVLSPDTKVMPLQDITIFPGDHWGGKGGPSAVKFDKVGKPVAVGCCGFDLLGAEG
jgi:hypothetical protein